MKAPNADAGDGRPEDENSPFAIEIGTGTTFDGGFALGALRDSEGSTQAMLATVDASGQNGKLVKLARARSDLDPPVVTGAGASVLVAMLEPNAGGRAVKLAKVTGTDVAWGPEFSEGKDESMALDLAASGARAAVAWDDLTENGKVSAVFLASFDVSHPRQRHRAAHHLEHQGRRRLAARRRPARRASGSAGSPAATPSPRRSRRARTRTRRRAKRRRRRSPTRTRTAKRSTPTRPPARRSSTAGSRSCPSTSRARRRRRRAPSRRRTATSRRST